MPRPDAAESDLTASEVMEAYWRNSPFWDDIKRQREIAAMFTSGPSWRELAKWDDDAPS